MQYPYDDVINYLRTYEKYPQAEMLVKFGLAKYATSVQILKKVAKDKAFRKWLVQKRNENKLRRLLRRYNTYCIQDGKTT